MPARSAARSLLSILARVMLIVRTGKSAIVALESFVAVPIARVSIAEVVEVIDLVVAII